MSSNTIAQSENTVETTGMEAQVFEILNAIYLHKMATVAHVVDVTALGEELVEAALRGEEGAGTVLSFDGSWLLQETGTAKVLRYYHSKYAVLRASGTITKWYERFETSLNQQFIKAVSEWQVSDGDSHARDKMAKLVERMMRHLSQIVEAIPRYQKYATRFEQAMTRADRGEVDYVCKPTVDSMHNIWFEFHEDILAVVGRPRDV